MDLCGSCLNLQRARAPKSIADISPRDLTSPPKLISMNFRPRDFCAKQTTIGVTEWEVFWFWPWTAGVSTAPLRRNIEDGCALEE